MIAGYRVGQYNLDLGLAKEELRGTQADIFGIHYWSLEDTPDQSETFVVIGFLSERVIKIKSHYANVDFSTFLHEMTFSENTLVALQNTGLKGEGLARNYQHEWDNWFTSDEDSFVVSQVEAANSSPQATQTPLPVQLLRRAHKPPCCT